MFDFFKKKRPAHEEKVELAYKCYKPEAIQMFFNGGKEQMSKIINEISQICNVNLDKVDAFGYYNILTIYTDIAIRKVMAQMDNEQILGYCLQVKHKDIVKNREMAEQVLKFYEQETLDPKVIAEKYTSEQTRKEKVRCLKCKKEIELNSYGICQECLEKREKPKVNDEQLVEINENEEVNEETLEKIFIDANNFLINKNFEKASKLFLKYAEKAEKLCEEKNKKCYSFANSIEFYIYVQTHKDEECIYVKWEISKAYYYIGAISFEMKNLEDAMIYLNKALEWDPISFITKMELAEVYKAKKELKKYYNITLDSFESIYKEKDLARYYRNLGYYFIETKQWDIAKAVYLYSLGFENSNSAHHELQYIMKVTNNKELPEKEELKMFLKENRIPTYIYKENITLVELLYNSLQEQNGLSSPLGEYVQELLSSYESRKL